MSHLQRSFRDGAPIYCPLQRFLHRSHQESSPRSWRGSPLHIRCVTPAPQIHGYLCLHPLHRMRTFLNLLKYQDDWNMKSAYSSFCQLVLKMLINLLKITLIIKQYITQLLQNGFQKKRNRQSWTNKYWYCNHIYPLSIQFQGMSHLILRE